MIVGNNIRISEVQALLLYSVLKEWKEIVENKISIANQYIDSCDKFNINYIHQNKNGHKGNYYKFILYNKEKRFNEYLPKLKTLTSGVYDYSLSGDYIIPKHHVCLPIWYGQEKEITDSVILELRKT